MVTDKMVADCIRNPVRPDVCVACSHWESLNKFFIILVTQCPHMEFFE